MRFIGIDPSTKTGIVALSGNGEVLLAKEIEKEGKDPERMSELIQAVSAEIEDTDIVVIEGFGFTSQRGFILGGIGWGIRLELYRRGISYLEIAPAALKKFATTKGNANKEKIAVEVYKRWGFEHDSNNVIDAYVLAQIARALNGQVELTKFQKEALNKIS
jgi:crossover junction endodeoxyribonuclease RuvC